MTKTGQISNPSVRQGSWTTTNTPWRYGFRQALKKAAVQQTFLIPEKLVGYDLDLPEGLQEHKALWMLDSVTAAHANHTTEQLQSVEGAFATLNSRVLREVVHNYNKYLRHFLHQGILETNNSYVAPRLASAQRTKPRCKGYRFPDTYRGPISKASSGKPLVPYRVVERLLKTWKGDGGEGTAMSTAPPGRTREGEGEDNARTRGSTRSSSEEPTRTGKSPSKPPAEPTSRNCSHFVCVRNSSEAPWLEQDYRYADNLETLGVQSSAFGQLRHFYHDELLSLDMCNVGLYSLANLHQDWYMKSKENCGRVFTSVNGMRRWLRPWLTINDDDNLALIDVSSCQPYLMLGLIREHCPTAYDDWRTEILFRDIYTSFGKLLPTFRTRDELKKLFLTILYCRNETHFPAKAAFRKRFPLVAAMIKKIKRKDHKQFPLMLQRLEGSIMIGMVCGALERLRIPSFTIHDGILVQAQHADEVSQIMRAAFTREIGQEPALKVDHLRDLSPVDFLPPYTGTSRRSSVAV